MQNTKIMNKEMAIYNELRAAAERVFNDGVQAPVGSYTLSDLAAMGNTKKAPGVAFRSEYNTDNIINISVNGFECSFSASRVFKIARRFEVLAKVSKKNCAIFTRKADSADPVAVFTLDATTCDSLAACDDPRKTLRPALACVFVDLAAGLAVCCDSYIMNVTHIQDVSIINRKSLINGGVLIPRDFAKAAKGCKVSIFKNNLDLIAVASNGNSCTLVREIYPNYKAVFEYTEKKAAAPVRLVKNVRELKKTAAAVAKVAACDVVYISGMTGDEYITLSANGDGGEISRRVALSSGLTFNFATALKVANIKSINNAADTLYISYFNTIVFAGAKVVGLVNPSYDSDNATPTAAGAKKIATKLKDFCNVYKEFTAPVAPADSIQTEDTADTADTIHVAPVVPADSIQTVDSTDTADTLHVAPVVPADSIQTVDTAAPADTIHVAPVVPADSIQTVDSTDTADTIHVAPIVPADSIQTVDSTDTADTIHVAPVVPADSIQAVDSTDTADTLHVVRRRNFASMFNVIKVAAVLLLIFVLRTVSTIDTTADTLHVAPVAPADSIQTVDNADTLDIAPAASSDSIQVVESTDNTDTLDIAPAASSDSIQVAESTDNADTLHVAPVAPADSIQTVDSTDTADTIHVAPVAPAKNLYIIGHAKNW